MEVIIAELEQRYQTVFGDFQAGKIDEGTFIAEVDKFQFKDDWGRYWMLGAQTGAWHYYDGQSWHQADPRDAHKLPFMDDQSRYWQRGAKSGDWYYYQAETDEWVKPGEGDPSAPSTVQQKQPQAASAFAGQPAYAQPQSTEPVPGEAVQFEAELFQDDEGRYWTVGAKTGQWYFYDNQGWHPAHEFQSGMAGHGQQPLSYQPQASVYAPQPQPTQPIYQAAAAYATQPQQPQANQTPQVTQTQFGGQQSASRQSVPIAQPDTPAASQAEQFQPEHSSMPISQPQPVEQQTPAGPQPAQTHATQPQPVYQQSTPQPTQGYAPTSPQTVQEASESYTVNPQTGGTQPSGEPPTVSPTSGPPQGASQSGTWFYHDGKQWLKYSSGEPADEPPPDPRMILDQEADKAKVKSKSEPIVAEFFEDDEPPIEVVDVEVITVIEAEPDEEPEAPVAPPAPKHFQEPPSFSASATSDIRPRRSRPIEEPPAPDPAPSKPERQPGRRTPSDSVRPVTPRKKTSAPDPTIIIPTGATASGMSSTSSRVNRPPKKRTQSERRRARENTMPMEPVPLPTADAHSVPARSQHRQVTQSMPKITASRADTGQVKVAKRARQVTEEIKTPLPVNESTSSPQTQTEGFTLGTILRSFPSTFWSIIAGVAVLLVVCALIVFGVPNLPLGVSSVDPVTLNLTPTLAAAIVDTTPTVGPTPTTSTEVIATPTSVSMIGFNSTNLGFGVEHPEDWLTYEDDVLAIFSPSEEGLDPEKWGNIGVRIGMPSDNSSSISDLLTDVLAQFPPDAETLNEGTISIASQTWTSTQIRFEDKNLGGPGIAMLAVTSKDGAGYYLIALAPEEEWNSVQPLYQGIINSFEFNPLIALAAAVSTSEPISAIVAETTTEPAEDVETTATPTPASTQKATVIPESGATPLVYIVQPGDTLLGIAVDFGVDVDLLASENGITDPGSLRVDQELTIPFTAEELVAYNAGAGLLTESAADDTSSESTVSATDTTEVSETDAETAPVETETTPEEEPAPASDAAAVSGRIVYPAFDAGANKYNVWMLNIATGEQTPLADEASQPAFNKDGSLLAYRSWGLSTRGIFFQDFVGGRGGKVTNFGEDGLPTWSPDGYTFAFASRKEGDRVTRIYIGDQDGGDTFGLSFQGEYPAMFPDGRLVVKGCTPGGDCGIFVMGGSGGGEKKISGEGGDTAPAPSPDGSKVAFMSIGRGGANWEIWVMNADGSDARRLTENGNNDGLPAWSPDGQSIAYVSDQGGVWALWVMNADGSNQRKLADMKDSPDGKVLHDEFNSRGWLEERISWAP